MNPRLLLGVLLPLIVIVVLVVLSGSSAGFARSVQTVESIKRVDLISDYSGSPKRIPIQTVTLTNDNILPRRYEVSRVTGCLIGAEGNYIPQGVTMVITEGSYIGRRASIIEDLFDRNYWGERSIQVGARSNVTYTVFADQVRKYNNDQFDSYDTLLIVEHPNDRYLNCARLQASHHESAIRIPLI